MIDTYVDLIFLSSADFNSFFKIILLSSHQILLEFLII